jgi:hypothetical protein
VQGRRGRLVRDRLGEEGDLPASTGRLVIKDEGFFIRRRLVMLVIDADRVLSFGWGVRV